MSTTIVIADDHTLFRAGVRSLLEAQPGMRVVGEACSGREALEQVRIAMPRVVLMDLMMPGLNGIEATRLIHEEHETAAVLVLTTCSGGPSVGQALRAGASGYVLKTAGSDELIEAIKSVAAGQVYLSRGVTGAVVEQYVRNGHGHGNGNGNGHGNGDAGDGSAYSLLTAREREVLQLVAEGHATKEIAGQLSVSVKTIETHRHTVMRKLDMPSIAHLTKYAVREGLTALDG